MANLSINGKIQSTDQDILFGDLVRKLVRDSNHSNKVISEIFVNDKYIDENMEQHISMKRVGDLGDIRINFANPLELAQEALTSASAYITKMIPKCTKAGQLFQEEDKAIANKYFLTLIDGLDNLTKLIVSAQSVLRDNAKNIKINDSSLRVAQMRLVSAVQELYPARKKNDWVLLADILINELPDALKEMRDYGIPVLKRIQVS